MAKARFLSSALDGQTVTLSATQGLVTRGPTTVSVWGGTPVEPGENLTVTVKEVLPAGDLFAPLPVEWRIRVTGTSYATPLYDPGIDNPVTYAPPYASLTQEQEDTMRLGWEAHDPSYQRCHFVVHTGDTGNYRNDWVGSAAHRNKAFQYGQNCGHVYTQPGTYNRSIYVYDDEGNWGTLALDPLEVVNPDTVFDAASTIVVADDGDWTGAPAHDVANRFTTLDEAAARFQDQKNKAAVTKGMRICIKAGSQFTERSRTFWSRDAKGPCLVDTYGGSERFTYSERDLDVAVNTSIENGDELFSVGDEGWAWRIRNGIFDLGYDVLAGRPTNPDGWLGGAKTLNRKFLQIDNPANIQIGGKDPAARIVLDNVDVTGCGSFCINGDLNVEIQAREVALFANDCEFYGNADYAFFEPTNLFALGTKLRAIPNADLGGMGRGTTMGTSRGWVGHPIFLREQLAWTVYIRACYMESRGSWFGVGSQTGFRGTQPIMRLNNRGAAQFEIQPAGWIAARGKRYFFCDSVMVGYFNSANIEATELGNSLGGGHIVIENCILVLDPQGGSFEPVVSVSGRFSTRNCIFLAPDTPPTNLFGLAGRDGTYDRFNSEDNSFGRLKRFFEMYDNPFKHNSRMEFRHNTYVQLRPEARLQNGEFVIRANEADKPYDDADYEIVEGHNVTYAPNMASPPAGAITSPANMALLDLPVGMRILDVWIKFNWEKKFITLAASVANGAETAAFEYPVDWYQNATTGASYATNAGNNSLESVWRYLSYDGLTADFVVGETLSGAESGNAAEIVEIITTGAATGILRLATLPGELSTGAFKDNEIITSASGSAFANGGAGEIRFYQVPKDYPNANGVQQGAGEGNEDKITVIHNCNAAGVVQGDDTGTHFKILNRSGVTWAAGDYVVILDRSGSAGMAVDDDAALYGTVDQTELKLYRPTTPQALDSGLGSTLWDFNRNLRPNAGFAISPTSGTNAAGAILPA